MNLEEIKKMNIHERLHAIMSEVGSVPKKGENEFHKYKYAKEADYVDAIRPLLSKYRVSVIPQTEMFSFTPENTTLVNLKIHYILTNIDNPEDHVNATIIGQGQDKGDKAIYKAITGAKKYFIANTFMIATNDDPEADSPEKGVDTPKRASSFRKTATKVETTVSEKKPTSFRKALVAPVSEKKVANDDF